MFRVRCKISKVDASLLRVLTHITTYVVLSDGEEDGDGHKDQYTH